MIILLISLFFFSAIQSAGFVGNTLFLKNYGQAPCEKINYKTLVQLNEAHVHPVLFINKQSIKKWCRLLLLMNRLFVIKTVLVPK